MRVKDNPKGEPVTGTFWLLARLIRMFFPGGRSACNTGILASARGNGPEVLALSVMAGLAILGVTAGMLMDFFGLWGLVALFPAWAIVLHVIGLSCAGAGALLQRLGLLKRSWRQAFNGAVFGFVVAAAALLQLRLGEPAAWLTLPWLGFVAIECLVWPSRRILEFSGERG